MFQIRGGLYSSIRAPSSQLTAQLLPTVTVDNVTEFNHLFVTTYRQVAFFPLVDAIFSRMTMHDKPEMHRQPGETMSRLGAQRTGHAPPFYFATQDNS
jgi:hypothetical protein